MTMGNSDLKKSMERKSDAVRRLVAEKHYKDALKIAKDFRIGISKSDSDDMKRGYECIVYPQFYKQLGYDTDKIAQKGVETLKRLYGNHFTP